VTDDSEREQSESENAPEPEAERPEAEAGQPAAEGPAAAAPDAPEPPEQDSADQPAAEAPAEPAPEPAAEAEAPGEPAAKPEAPVEPAPEPAAEAEAATKPEAPAEAADRARKAAAAKKDVVPGADLEPIAIDDDRELTAEERAAREAEEEERRAREAAAADHEEEAIAPRSVSVPADAQIQATGKRKSAIARVVVRAGDGSFQINDRGIEEYFHSGQHQAQARQPLVATGYEGSVDVKVRVHGGGVSGQAGAVRHGVARALTQLEPELRGELKRRGMLTRDDRRKERKKAGLKKARKRPQFSKR